MEKKKFNVLNWDFNSNKLIQYDVLPYFRDCYKDIKKSERPKSKEEWLEFVKRNGKYMYWSRCEYEIIVSNWPSQDTHRKIDIWHQIEMNIGIIVDILMEEFN